MADPKPPPDRLTAALAALTQAQAAVKDATTVLAVARSAVDQAEAGMGEAKKLCVKCGGPDDVAPEGARWGAVHAPHAKQVEAGHAEMLRTTAAYVKAEQQVTGANVDLQRANLAYIQAEQEV